jgi:Zn-dependent protease
VLEAAASSAHRACKGCGTELARQLLACPACGTLVFAAELKQLADSASRAATPVEALGFWREALELLPAGSRQREAITGKIDALVTEVERTPAGGRGKSQWGKVAAGAGVVAIFLAKFKFIIFFLLTKAKLLLLGLTKMSTLLTMFVSFGLYWTLWGWKFAAGIILSIYVHEMGHVAMLARLGVAASAPMFIPGLGAIVRLRQHLPTAREDARVGLAGPIWGLGAALAAWGLGVALHAPLFLAVAKVGAWINLFNLTPIWQLDGSRAFRALTKPQRWMATGSVVAALLLAAPDSYGVLLIVLLFAIIRLFEKDTATQGDQRALVEYVGLIAALTLIASIHVPR